MLSKGFGLLGFGAVGLRAFIQALRFRVEGLGLPFSAKPAWALVPEITVYSVTQKPLDTQF